VSFGALGTAPPVELFTSPGPSYGILERVLTAAAGRPAAEVIHDRILARAGLDRTVMDDGRLGDSLVARGYTAPFGATVVVTGLVGPLADLFHWHQALYGGALLPPSQRERMLTPHGNGYAFGAVVGRTTEGDRIIEHASDQTGFQLWSGYFPDRDILVLLAANSDDGFRQPIAARLTALLTAGAATAEADVTRRSRAGGE
jgi:CubicO group peptidase (beta-lactamase class C family)